MLVDSHCHLQLMDYAALQQDEAATVQAAMTAGVEHMLCVATRLDQHTQLAALRQRYASVNTSIGLHPNEEVEQEPSVEGLLALQATPRVVAIGETGLDYYRTEAGLAWQHERFRTQIRVANEVQKPLIIHTRQARADTIKILQEESASRAGGVIHCFTEDWDTASAAMDLGFYISFSGIVTFKNAKDLQEVARRVPAERILVETDCPYLAPTPFRGKINQPAYVRHVAEFLASLRSVDFASFAKQTTDNYYRLFGRGEA